MPKASHAALKAIRTFALALPGTEPKSPWPGHDDVAVNDKTFLYLGRDEATAEPSFGVKLPVSGPAVLRSRNARPMGYGLGNSGWISMVFPAGEMPPLDTLKRWVLESYCAQAPKRLLKDLEKSQPWVAAGGLPE